MTQSADYDALVTRLTALADALAARCPARIGGRIVACQDGHAHGCAMLPTEAATLIRGCVIPPGQDREGFPAVSYKGTQVSGAPSDGPDSPTRVTPPGRGPHV